ncbi:MAG: efflux RND transporter periplasmic adaptor subunit [Ketobacter sp.]
MKKPYLIAIAMFAALVIWMATGLLGKPDATEQVQTPAEKTEKRVLVQTQTQNSQPVQLELTVQGHVEPNREVIIRSDIAGRVQDVLVEDGQHVEAGTLLVRFDMEDRKSKLAKEEALLESRRQAYSRTEKLGNVNFQSKSAIEDAFAALKEAEANVAEIRNEINKLEVRAPFAGVVDRRAVEKGAYLLANGEIARFVDNNPLKVVVPIAQQNIKQLSKGVTSEVDFAIGQKRPGTLKFISPLANEQTRTFRVEISVDNPGYEIPAGISAEVKIPTSRVSGHFVSPAILALDEQGRMGIKTVDDTSSVIFNPVSIIQATKDGIWVEGLPDSARIITVGQGFVEAGAKVDVAEKNSDETHRAAGVASYIGSSQ